MSRPMSSSTYTARIESIHDHVITFRLLPTGAGGLRDEAWTRSFALDLLLRAAKAAPDTLRAEQRERVDAGTLEEDSEEWWALQERIDGARDTAKRAPIVKAIGVEPIESAAWCEANVSTYVVRTEVTERFHTEDEASLRARFDQVSLEVEQAGASSRELTRRLFEVMFSYALRVEVTHPQWLAGLESGRMFETTAFDFWPKDPMSQR